MAWMLLFLAGLFEVAWAVGLKYTAGFTQLLPSIATIAAYIGSLVLLSLAMRTLPLGTAYAVWVGIGVLGANLLGAVLFGESFSPTKLVFLGLLLVSVVGLKQVG